jgi:hypothetical protein
VSRRKDEKKDPVFVDTSIQIARVVHGPKTKEQIQERLAKHGQAVTGLVVRQEFKRRLLKEAVYLLDLLERFGSFGEVQQYLIRFQPKYKWLQRKKNICLQAIAEFHAGATDEERTERFKLYLRSLLVTGLRRFDQQVDTLRQDSCCACGRTGVTEKKAFRKYDLGPDHCSRQEARNCGIVSFLTNCAELRERVLKYLRALPEQEKTAELKNAQAFLEKLTTDLAGARKEDPCLKVGDLLIALESAGIPNFYTLNWAESQHLCRPLQQTLIVCPVSPLNPEVVCPKEQKEWPAFGKQGSAPGQGRAEDPGHPPRK